MALSLSSFKIRRMHKVLLPIIVSVSLLALTSCGKPPDDAIARNCDVERTTVEDLSFCLPDGWSAISQAMGEQSSFVVAVNDNNVHGLVMQLHVKKDLLQEPVTDEVTFAERAVEISRETAPHYKPISTNPVTVDGKETILHIFDASPDEKDPETVVRYYQFVTTHEGYAYGLTAVFMPEADKDLEESLIEVLTSMRFV